MRTCQSFQIADVDNDQVSDWNGDDMDMICLVYPDGSTKNVSARQSQSKD